MSFDILNFEFGSNFVLRICDVRLENIPKLDNRINSISSGLNLIALFVGTTLDPAGSDDGNNQPDTQDGGDTVSGDA